MEHWLDTVYRDHAPALYRFLARLTRDEAETKDVLQEIFLRLARAPGTLDHVASPRSFLFRMAHRLVIDRARRDEARHRASENAARVTEPVAPPDFGGDDFAWRQRCLASQLELLPLAQKAVVVLKVWEGMTFAEIADALDIPPNTAASRYRYALDKLRGALRPLHREQP